MGRVAAPYAVRGWVKIQTFTENLDSLLDYPVWQLRHDGQWRNYSVREAKPHGHYLVAWLAGVGDRTTAAALCGSEVAVARAERPPAGKDEYYWDDLIGLTVVNLAGDTLGQVSGLLETGAQDVMQVTGERERLIPFVAPIVHAVDQAHGRILVDWERDY